MNFSFISELFFIEPTKLTTKLYQYSSITISSLGCVFNLLCFLIFNTKKFSKKKLYFFLKVYALNSLLINSLQFFTFLASILRLTHLTNTFEYIVFKSYVYSPIVTTCYFFSGVLDSYILMERCSHFFSKLKVLFQPSPKLACLALFCSCLLINSPYFFIKITASSEFNSTFVVHHSVESSFGTSTFGRVLTFGVYFVRDIVTLVSVVGLNILLYVSVRTHTNTRNERFNFSKRDCSVSKNRTTSETSFQRNSREHRLTFIIIIICSISVVEHLFQIISNVYSNYVSDMISDYLNKVSDVTLAFKQSSNFLIFGFFDRNFDRALTNFFRRCL